MDIKQVIAKYEEQLLSLPNVQGVGEGEKKSKKVIKVLVTHKVPVSTLRPEEVIPKTLEEYETDVEEIGIVIAQEGDQKEGNEP